MLSSGVPEEAFWTSEEVTGSVAMFPIAPQQDTQWINSFESHIQDMDAENLLSHELVGCALTVV